MKKRLTKTNNTKYMMVQPKKYLMINGLLSEKSGNKDFKDGKFMKNLEKNFGINKNF